MMRSRSILATLLLAVAAAAVHAAPQSPPPTAAPAGTGEVGIVSVMRDAGYTLGDLVHRRIELTLPPGARIDRHSLPTPGRIVRWLELREVTIRDATGAKPVLEMTYQVFGAPDTAVRAWIPEMTLGLLDGGPPSIVVPSQPVHLSPVLPLELDAEMKAARPAPDPQPLSTRPHRIAVTAGGFAALVGLFALLWIEDRLPFLPRHPGPMTRLWRRWRRAPARLDEGQQRTLLEEFHAALSGSAGETLYPGTLERLFGRATYLQPLREPIAAAFAASWRFTYGPVGQSAPDPEAMLALIRRAADRERGWR